MTTETWFGYAIGDRIEFDGFGEPDPTPDALPVGTRGTVQGGNEGQGQLWVRWDNGSSLAVLIGHARHADHTRPLDRVHRVADAASRERTR